MAQYKVFNSALGLRYHGSSLTEAESVYREQVRAKKPGEDVMLVKVLADSGDWRLSSLDSTKHRRHRQG